MAAREASGSAWASAIAARSRRNAAAGTGGSEGRGPVAGTVARQPGGTGATVPRAPGAARFPGGGRWCQLNKPARTAAAVGPLLRGAGEPRESLTGTRFQLPPAAAPTPAATSADSGSGKRRFLRSGGRGSAASRARSTRGLGAAAPADPTEGGAPHPPRPRPVSACRPSPGSPSWRRRRAGRRRRHGPGAGCAVSGAGRGWRRCGRCCCSVSTGAALRQPGIRLRAALRGLRAPPWEPRAGGWTVGSAASGGASLVAGPRSARSGWHRGPQDVRGSARLRAALRSEQLFAESTLLERQKIPNGRCPSAGASSS